jgi:hypothetical protein
MQIAMIHRTNELYSVPCMRLAREGERQPTTHERTVLYLVIIDSRSLKSELSVVRCRILAVELDLSSTGTFGALDERAREQLRRRAARTTPSDSAVRAAAVAQARGNRVEMRECHAQRCFTVRFGRGDAAS